MTLELPGYTLKREIGSGGMAAVYLAVQDSLDRRVALKVMSPALAADQTFTKRFLREAKTVAALNHPHVVSVYDVGVTDNHLHYFSMEFLPNGDFADRIRRGTSQEELIRVLTAIANALGFAHDRGYVHRDVKPGNILFNATDTPVLTDFGIARAATNSTRMTGTGVSVGTSHYMSPEQARGKEVDGRSDLYSLGVVAFEALAGRTPFSGEDGFAIAYSHVFDPVPALPPEVENWQEFINKALAKRPDDRFQTAAEMVQVLRSLRSRGEVVPSAAEDTHSSPTTPLPTVGGHRPTLRHRIAVLTAVLRGIPGTKRYAVLQRLGRWRDEGIVLWRRGVRRAFPFLPPERRGIAGVVTVFLLVALVGMVSWGEDEEAPPVLVDTSPEATAAPARASEGPRASATPAAGSAVDDAARSEGEASVAAGARAAEARPARPPAGAAPGGGNGTGEPGAEIAASALAAAPAPAQGATPDALRRSGFEAAGEARQLAGGPVAVGGDPAGDLPLTRGETRAPRRDAGIDPGVDAGADGGQAPPEVAASAAELAPSAAAAGPGADGAVGNGDGASAGGTALAPADSGDPAPPAAEAGRVAALLALAAADLEEDRLTTPAERNAFDRYRAVLDLDPGNPDALAGLADIVDRYFVLSRAATRRADFDAAVVYIDRAEPVADLGRLRAGLDEARVRLFDALDASAEEALEAGERGSALAALRAARRLRPGDAALAERIEAVENRAAPSQRFRDPLASGGEGPEMIVVALERFQLATGEGESLPIGDSRTLAVSTSEITVGLFARFVEATNHYELNRQAPCRQRESRWRASRSRYWAEPGFSQSDDHPVVCITWEDATALANWLSSETGLVYRLPTEAEWEYLRLQRSARAGPCELDNVGDIWLQAVESDRAALECEDGWTYTAPVSAFPAGPLGFTGLPANVREWTADCWNSPRAAGSTSYAPALSGDCRKRVVKGGSWWHGRLFDAADREGFGDDDAYDTVGFRLVRALD